MSLVPRNELILLRAITLIAGMTLTGANSATAATPILVGFSQPDNQSLKIQLDRKVSSIRILRLDDVPSKINVRILSHRPAQKLASDSDSALIQLPKNNLTKEYSLVVFLSYCDAGSVAAPPRCNDADYFEIVRQTPGWLKAKFNFDRKDGYSLLGRRSITVSHGVKRYALAPIVLKGRPKIELSSATPQIPAEIRPYPELVQATKIIRFLWAKPIRTGPAAGSYLKFLKQTLETKLRLIRTGEYSVQCSGMRDLFLHAIAAFPHLQARAVEAVNYIPVFPDLVPYGHSTSEVWVQSLNRWILIDAWMGVALKDKSGRLLSASDLHPGMGADIEIIALTDALTRFTINPGGKKITIVDVPSDMSLSDYTQTKFGHIPGYLEYFRKVRYHSPIVEE